MNKKVYWANQIFLKWLVENSPLLPTRPMEPSVGEILQAPPKDNRVKCRAGSRSLGLKIQQSGHSCCWALSNEMYFCTHDSFGWTHTFWPLLVVNLWKKRSWESILRTLASWKRMDLRGSPLTPPSWSDRTPFAASPSLFRLPSFWLRWVESLLQRVGPSLVVVFRLQLRLQGVGSQLPRGLWDLRSLTRGRVHVPCIGRRILNHWTHQGSLPAPASSPCPPSSPLACFPVETSLPGPRLLGNMPQQLWSEAGNLRHASKFFRFNIAALLGYNSHTV